MIHHKFMLTLNSIVKMACTLAMLSAYGCETRTPYSFQFVGASTEKPLRDVSVKWMESGNHFKNRFLGVSRSIVLSASAQDAVISLDLVYEWRNDLIVKCRGYRVAHLHNYPYPSPDSWYIYYADKDDLVEPWKWSDSALLTLPANVLTKIPMYRLGEQAPAEQDGGKAKSAIE